MLFLCEVPTQGYHQGWSQPGFIASLVVLYVPQNQLWTVVRWGLQLIDLICSAVSECYSCMQMFFKQMKTNSESKYLVFILLLLVRVLNINLAWESKFKCCLPIFSRMCCCFRLGHKLNFALVLPPKSRCKYSINNNMQINFEICFLSVNKSGGQYNY